jgi:hypothetical protein
MPNDEARPPSPFAHPYYANAKAARDRLLKASPLATILGGELVDKTRGGMGEILIVRTPAGKGPPALKVLKTLSPVLSLSSDAVAALADEALTMTRIETPGCLPIENVHRLDRPRGEPLLCLQLPYCAGGSLADRLAAGPPSREEIAAVLLAVAAALAGLHREGLVHRDLKPQNLLFDVDDTGRWAPLLSDFGLTTSAAKRTGGFAGTPAFAAPEQLRGEATDGRIDVWAWGVLAALLLTGEHPFAEALEVKDGCGLAGLAERISSAPRRLPADAVAWGPRALAALIPACLDPDPAARPDMKSVLGRLLAETSIAISDDGRQVVGPLEGADVAFTDLRLGAGLWEAARELGLPPPPLHGCRIGTVSLPWPKRLKRAEVGVELGTPASCWAAVREADRVLGRWEDPASPLGQFVANPKAEEYSTGSRIRGVEDIEQLRIDVAPLPRGAFLHLLKLRLQALIDLAQDGSSAAVEELRAQSRRWCEVGDFGVQYREAGTPPEGILAAGPSRQTALRLLAVASLLAGEPDQAERCFAEFKPPVIVEFDTKRAFGMYLMARGRWAEAGALCEALAKEVAETRPPMSLGCRITAAQCAVEAGDPGLGLERLSDVLWRNLQITAVSSVAAHRLAGELPARVREAMAGALAAASEDSPVDARWLVEFAWRLGERASAERLARQALCNPRLYVPLHRHLRPLFESVVRGEPDFPGPAAGLRS